MYKIRIDGDLILDVYTERNSNKTKRHDRTVKSQFLLNKQNTKKLPIWNTTNPGRIECVYAVDASVICNGIECDYKS